MTICPKPHRKSMYSLTAECDGDFHCLIEYLEKQGKLLHIIIPNSRKCSALLRKYRRYFVHIDKLSKKLFENKKERD